MKTQFVALMVIVCLGGAAAQAMTYLGPPTTRMNAGQWSIGGVYSNSEQDIELDRSTEFSDVEEEVMAVLVSVGLADQRAEIYGIFGVADIDQGDIEGDEEFLGGFGGRITTNPINDELDWGIVGQFTYVSAEDTGVILDTATPYELRAVDIQIGFGPCWRPGDFLLYGGPYIHWIEGDLETEVFGDYDINAESWFGAYIGGGVELIEHLTVTAEVQATPDALGVAASAVWRF